MKKTRKILFSAALLSSGLTMAQTTTAAVSYTHLTLPTIRLV